MNFSLGCNFPTQSIPYIGVEIYPYIGVEISPYRCRYQVKADNSGLILGDVPTRTMSPIVRSHIGWREKRSIPYVNETFVIKMWKP